MESELNDLVALFNALPVEIIELDASLRIRRHNRGGRIGISIFDLPDFDETRDRAPLERVLREGGGAKLEAASSAYRVSRAQGSSAPSLCLVRDGASAPKLDHVDRQRLQVTLKATQIGLWSWDLVAQEVRWDERMFEITGVERALTLGEWIEKLTHPEDRDRVRSIRSGLSNNGPFAQSTTRIVRPDGELRWVTASGAVIPDSDGAPRLIVGGVLDVTEQYLLSAELEDARRREAMGHLTAGVAHNFNNMLMVIQPCLEQLYPSIDAPLQTLVGDALDAAKRAAEVVQNLMSFAGQSRSTQIERRSAAALCSQTARLCGHGLPEEIELRISVESTACFEAPAGAIEQVLSNILLNARDTLLEHEVDAPLIKLVVSDEIRFGESWVQIIISDNGPGVPEEIRPHIFEPFFSTRGGNGTGLGLATSDSIVSQLGGQIACRRSPTGGAEFLVLLPAATTAGETGPSASPRAAPPDDERTLRVLMIDDEQAIRRIVPIGLESHNISCHPVESAERARAVLSDPSSGTFDFVLLDRSLRRSLGRELLPELRERLPGAPIFFFTGESVEPEIAAQVDGVFQKPFSLAELGARIRQACTDG